MQYMGVNELREKFLSFYESKGHLRLPSFPLVPQNDNSLLLINSGMAPLKRYFTGEQVPPRHRVTTCQKCIRTPDIERVGKTARHGTFFEMLGNFSFGDYFKWDATAWAWEFITKVLEIPEDKLWVTIYEDDDEARDIWINHVGVKPERIVRMGKEDNFWEIGMGPCGPCSEIYFDRGEQNGCGKPDCAVGCDCDRYVEFWNLVFTQFDNDGNGNYTPLQKKNIDTGMGLERLACIMQGVDNLFEVDTVRNIMLHISKIAGVEYKTDAKKDVSLRVITDHIRSTTMMVCDGVIPSNEGRGYVLRRLLRRAARHGKLLGITRPFLSEVCDTVIRESGDAYPELREKAVYIKKVISMEEERFNKTIDSGLKILSDLIEKMEREGQKVLSGDEAFKLYDTFGFPIDLTLEILDERGLTVDQAAFDKAMNEQKARARAATEKLGDFGWTGEDLGLDKTLTTEFVGYDHYECEGKVWALVAGGEIIDTANAGMDVTVVLDRTPFYAEMGGQVADYGMISGADGCVLQVTNVVKSQDGKFLHKGKVVSGAISAGDTVNAKIDIPRRRAIMRAHSATHLLQRALRRTLGEHVEQAGSYVEPDRLRFDFTHFAALTPEELSAVENEVNEMILADLPVDVREMPIAEAKKLGAMALFGEKYGDVVRVVRMGDYSTELCGGTHLENTAKAGSIKIVSETSIAAGVRRVEAVVGMQVAEFISEKQRLILETCERLHTTPAELWHRAEQLNGELRDMSKKVDRLNAKVANYEIINLFNFTKAVGDVNVLAVKLDDIDMDTLRGMGDMIRDRAPKLVAVLSIVADGKINFLCVCGKEAVAKGAHAGNIIREVAKLCGGGGGGKPDSATAGGRDVSKLEAALESVNDIVAKMLKK